MIYLYVFVRTGDNRADKRGGVGRNIFQLYREGFGPTADHSIPLPYDKGGGIGESNTLQPSRIKTAHSSKWCKSDSGI